MTTSIGQEWQLLQTQFDSYEKFSLIIKLIHLSLACLLLSFSQPSYLLIGLGGLFWLQDGIWKTFQARVETRLLKLEQNIEGENSVRPFQFNSEFLAQRGSNLSLILEYLKQSLKPTVAFPHVVLLLIYLILITFG